MNGRFLRAKIPFQLVNGRRQASTKTEQSLVRVKQDLVGSPDPISNIRPISFYVPKNETTAEKQLRLLRQKAQVWHQDFWSKHNTAFVKERKEFEESYCPKGASLGADEMSVFYKQFLDKYWLKHLSYNFEWYKLNFSLLGLAFKVEIERYLRKVKNR